MRRRVFLHFVDHEILKRMTAARVPVSQVCERLIRISLLASPEPPLFPISAHHEEPAISELLHSLMPLIQCDLLRIAGNGSTPRANLDRRREQFNADRDLFKNLFSPSQDLLVDAFRSSWVEKQGNTSASIRMWWTQSLIDPQSLLSQTLYRGLPVSDRQLARYLEIPYVLEARPLLADVVAVAVNSLNPTAGAMAELREDLGVHLTRQWASVYADKLDATVFRDFGHYLPEMAVFTPNHFPTSSIRKLELLLLELELLYPIVQLPIVVLSEVLEQLRVEREYVADELLRQSTQNVDRARNTFRRQQLVAAFRRRRSRSIFWMGRSKARMTRGQSDETRRTATRLARGLENYAVAIGIVNDNRNWERVTVDRSFHISQVTGDVHVAQDSATINNVTFTPAAIGEKIMDASKSEGSAKEFVEWLTQSAAVDDNGITSGEIVKNVDTDQLTAEKKSLLARIGQSLATSATQSTVIVAVAEAIKSLAS
ncbi:hypothetical protein ACIA8G_21500 [Lentzea sp. NPDC051213]|uniref:hypothetical protein n=1 Tax=Lentzea sp. NPDC051213 TaxID=3364126 RepID=UPI0037B529B7